MALDHGPYMLQEAQHLPPLASRHLAIGGGGRHLHQLEGLLARQPGEAQRAREADADPRARGPDGPLPGVGELQLQSAHAQ
eukprot:246630-Prymnesium_polylepis.1